MQRYWSMRETQEGKRIVRSYGFAKDAKDAIKKAHESKEKEKGQLLRVWVAFLEADTPVFTLAWGEPANNVQEIPLDNASKGIAKEFKKKSGKKERKSVARLTKPRIRLQNKPEAPAPYWPEYRVMFSDTFLKERASAS